MPKILAVNKRHYRSHRFGEITISFVLVPGEADDYAVYAGQGTDTWVAENGNKIPFDEACEHFPGNQLKEDKYRR